MIATDALSPIDVVVWGENCDDSARFLNPILRHKLINAAKNKKEREMIHGDIVQSLKLEKSTSLNMAVVCNDPDGKVAVASGKVLLCTLNTAGSRSLRNAIALSNDKPELCIVDEAGQCTEAEFYIATTFSSIKRLVVFGDPGKHGEYSLSV